MGCPKMASTANFANNLPRPPIILTVVNGWEGKKIKEHSFCPKHGLAVLSEKGCHVCIRESLKPRPAGRPRVGCILEKCNHCWSQQTCREIYTQDLWLDGDCPHFKPFVDPSP